MIPTGANNSEGAWEFTKFWIGYTRPAEAVRTCVDGGWIPVSDSVVSEPEFQEFLADDALFATFVELAASPNQFPIPMVPAGPRLKRSVESASYRIMNEPDADAFQILGSAEAEVQKALDQTRSRPRVSSRAPSRTLTGSNPAAEGGTE